MKKERESRGWPIGGCRAALREIARSDRGQVYEKDGAKQVMTPQWIGDVAQRLGVRQSTAGQFRGPSKSLFIDTIRP
jgi:hypothetical protein